MFESIKQQKIRLLYEKIRIKSTKTNHKRNKQILNELIHINYPKYIVLININKNLNIIINSQTLFQRKKEYLTLLFFIINAGNINIDNYTQNILLNLVKYLNCNYFKKIIFGHKIKYDDIQKIIISKRYISPFTCCSPYCSYKCDIINIKTFLQWIGTLKNGHFAKYKKQIKKQIKLQNIKVNKLYLVNYCDITSWSIINFQDRHYLEEKIANICIKTKLCRTCKLFRYCSKKCQKIDWKLRHKQICDKIIKF